MKPNIRMTWQEAIDTRIGYFLMKGGVGEGKNLPEELLLHFLYQASEWNLSVANNLFRQTRGKFKLLYNSEDPIQKMKRKVIKQDKHMQHLIHMVFSS